MAVLRILDISTFIHTGKVNLRAQLEGDLVETDSGWLVPSIPTGGIAYLFNEIRKFSRSSTMVFAADRDPLFRKAIDPGYKSNRVYEDNVEQQKMMAERILEDCNFSVCFMDRYEADDVIYSLTQKYKNQFEHIYIHTSDSDIFMNVADNVSIVPVRKNGKVVTMQNYSVMVTKQRYTPYNECNYHKMIYGDRSDTYSGLSDAAVIAKLIAITAVPEIHATLGDSKRYGDYIQSLVPGAYDKFCIAYPQEIPVDFDIYMEPNRKAINAWGYLVGNSGFTKADFDESSPEAIKANAYKEELLANVKFGA